MLTYDQPLMITHSVKANSGVSSAAIMNSIKGPAGLKGRVLAMIGRVTTGVTAAAASVNIYPDGTTEGSVFTGTVPIAAAGLGFSATAAQVAAGLELAADTTYDVYGGGESTAGAVDLDVVIGWYR
jgi:hypothetical protein